MIDEKIVIKDIENRIDTFVKQYPKEKDCRSVQVQREFIHILELAAKKQKAKEHERMLSIESELLGTCTSLERNSGFSPVTSRAVNVNYMKVVLNVLL